MEVSIKIYRYYFLPIHGIALIAGQSEIIILKTLKSQQIVFYSYASKRK